MKFSLNLRFILYIQLMNKFFAYLKTAAFRKNLMIAIASVIVFMMIAFFSLRFYTRHGESVPVPSLKGLPVEQAIELLKSTGLRYQIDSIYQMDKKPGMVVEQDPDANTSVKLNRTVYLTIITRNAPNVSFPDLLTLTFVEARAVLNGYGLKLGDTMYVSDIARDRVIKVKLDGVTLERGQQIPKGSEIDLVLGDGQGASEVDLPDLTGLTLSEAIFALKGSSLELGHVTYGGSISDSSALKVVKQSPALSDSITKVNIGTTIDITLSN